MTVNTTQGSIGWIDLSVENGEELKDFYAKVTGWRPEPMSMGEYNDYMMHDATGTPVAGICHARGVNANLPPQWVIYINVPQLEKAIEATLANGGKLIEGPRSCGPMGRFAVIQDPAGAFASLFEPGSA